MDYTGILFIAAFCLLPIVISFIISVPKTIKNSKEAKIQIEEAKIRSIMAEEKSCAEKYREQERKATEVKLYYQKCIRELDSVIIQKCKCYPQISVIMADLLTINYERSAAYLDRKTHPAHTEAQRIRELRIKTKEILSQKKRNRI